MQVPILLPDVGAVRTVVSIWYVEPGETIYEGDRVLEALTSGATIDVLAPATGKFLEPRVFPEEPVEPGQVLGVMEVNEESD
jgi:2-oxoglutarate dehydrogenase E2 component (dihydrolipoamide succinyltransferase)/2-oxoisovalerate dehydrogenase E2 component (dihydrolipoyl transacylase)